MTVADIIVRHLLETTEASTLVIHKDDRSTDFLTAIYQGKGYPVVNGPLPADELKKLIKEYPRIYMLGHGCSAGLFGPGYLINESFGPLLHEKKDGLYIWCHAEVYARRQKLSGLVSGMFISEVGEAQANDIEATQEEVDASNAAFSAAVRSYLDQGAPPHTVKQCYNSTTCKITQFNTARLFIMENGVSLDAEGKPLPEPEPEQPRRYASRYDQDYRTGQEAEAVSWLANAIDYILDSGWQPQQELSAQKTREADSILRSWDSRVDITRIRDEYEADSDEPTALASIMYKTGLYRHIEHEQEEALVYYLLSRGAAMIQQRYG